MAVTQASRGKVRLAEEQIIHTLSESPKSSRQIAAAIGKTTSYVNIRLKILIEEKRVQLLETRKEKAGCGYARINIYTTDMRPTLVPRLKPVAKPIEVKRDYLQIAFFGDAK